MVTGVGAGRAGGHRGSSAQGGAGRHQEVPRGGHRRPHGPCPPPLPPHPPLVARPCARAEARGEGR
eukprot:332608-Rhodomonas_salina.1